MDTNQNQRPEAEPVAQMIREAAAAGGITYEELAAATGQSKGRTGDILRGYGPRRADGTYPETTGQALILARLAQRAGVSAERVRQAGRDDVARMMEAVPTLADIPTADLMRELERRLRVREGSLTAPDNTTKEG